MRWRRAGADSLNEDHVKARSRLKHGSRIFLRAFFCLDFAVVDVWQESFRGICYTRGNLLYLKDDIACAHDEDQASSQLLDMQVRCRTTDHAAPSQPDKNHVPCDYGISHFQASFLV